MAVIRLPSEVIIDGQSAFAWSMVFLWGLLCIFPFFAGVIRIIFPFVSSSFLHLQSSLFVVFLFIYKLFFFLSFYYVLFVQILGHS